MKFIDPALGFKLIIWGGWILAALGGFKVLLYAVGEFFPRLYARARSNAVRRFMTGTGNRLIFGLGGFVTIFLGFLFVFLGHFIRRLSDLL